MYREEQQERAEDKGRGPSPNRIDKDSLEHEAPNPAAYIHKQQAIYVIGVNSPSEGKQSIE